MLLTIHKQLYSVKNVVQLKKIFLGEKMKSKWLLMGVITVSIVTLMTACSKIPNRVSVNESSNGKQVEVAVNGTITVTLDSNATTGYSWQLSGISDSSVLEKLNNVYDAPTGGLMGAGGKEVWTFKTLADGKATLSMEYDQPWAGGQKNAKSFDLIVVVK
jgi:inhibitor of cysteine peptidase